MEDKDSNMLSAPFCGWSLSVTQEEAQKRVNAWLDDLGDDRLLFLSSGGVFCSYLELKDRQIVDALPQKMPDGIFVRVSFSYSLHAATLFAAKGKRTAHRIRIGKTNFEPNAKTWFDDPRLALAEAHRRREYHLIHEAARLSSKIVQWSLSMRVAGIEPRYERVEDLLSAGRRLAVSELLRRRTEADYE